MKENNGIIWGFLMSFFPGAMRLFSMFPRSVYMALLIISVVFMLILFILRKKYRNAWLYCIPFAIVSLIVWCGYFSLHPVEKSYDLYTLTDFDKVPKELVEKADAGDVDAQIEVAMSLMTMQTGENGTYEINQYSDLERIRHYASMAAENNSSQGYLLAGIAKYYGIGGPVLRNQAINDFEKSIELDPNNRDAYVNLLRIDSLKYTHPEKFQKYNSSLEELIDKENRHAVAVLDSLYMLFRKPELSKEDLRSFLERHDDVMHEYLPKNQEIVYTLLIQLSRFNDNENLDKYFSYYNNPRSLNSLRILSHIDKWQLNNQSENVDSLLTLAPSVMLEAVMDNANEIAVGPYLDLIIGNEYINQLYAESSISKYRRDSIIALSIPYLQNLNRNLKPKITKKSLRDVEPSDSTETIVFELSSSYSMDGEFNGSASHSFQPKIVRLP